MARGKRVPAVRRGGEAINRHAARGSDDRWRGKKEPEDDPLRDLRPEEEEPADPEGDEFVWPEMSSENEEDD